MHYTLKTVQKLLLVAALCIGGVVATSAQLPIDLTTQLAKFLVDLRAGTLGVNQVISTITATGTIAGGNLTSASTGVITYTGREYMSSPANGLLKMGLNAGTTGLHLQINTGTANPTVTACGTGTVTANSTNTAGEITPTGATACTVTFGAPAFSNKPFCVVTPETTLEVIRVSAVSTFGFDVAFTTAANVFAYHCFGGQ